MKVKSAVVDTNVLISAALSPKGIPAQVVKHIILHGDIFFSDETYNEFYTRLWRAKFDSYISRESRKSILLDFSNIALWVKIDSKLKLSCDPSDDKFLEVAIKANVSMLISGDSDLTDLKKIGNIPIYTPAQCLKKLE